MHKKMGYFNGWKFGVPVTIIHQGATINPPVKARLVRETDDAFWVLTRIDTDRQSVMYYKKSDFAYIPIPYKVDNMQPRFPICVNRRDTAYCNKGSKMASLAVNSIDVQVTEVKELEGAKCSAKT